MEIAWAVYDAEFFGVAQRRRRIFLVADLAGHSAAEILFEREGLPGYIAAKRRTWEDIAAAAGIRRADAGGAEGGAGIRALTAYAANGRDEVRPMYGTAATITAHPSLRQQTILLEREMCLNDQGGMRMGVSEGVSGTLRADMGGHPPIVLGSEQGGAEVAFDLCPTLTASAGMSGNNRPVLFENHSQDCRYTGPLTVSQTVLSTFGTGGNNQPFVLQTPKTLKIRSGCEGGGKDALIQDDLSATLGTHNDQTVFVPKAYGICAKASHSMQSDNPNSGFYEADTSRCLDANGGNPNCNQGGIAVVAVQGSMIGRAEKNGPQGSGIGEDVSFTLNTADRHAVAFCEKAATLSANDGPKGPSSQQLKNPESNFVCEKAYGIDYAAFNQGQNAKFGFAVEEELEPTIVAKGLGAIAYSTYSSSKASFFTEASEEMANTLVATDYKDPPIVNDEDAMDYIVRRLTPTECARLQGFPDWWCDDLGTDEPTAEEISWWSEVFETHRRITGTSGKAKTENQIIKWLKDPHSDSAEYKMWGNGVALPNVVFVLSGIVYYSQLTGGILGTDSVDK